ncbi:MAG: protein kinase domain-containing protein [Planctomycetaceae bacterium]
MRRVLTQRFGLEPHHVRQLTDSEVTRNRIQQTIGEIARQAKPGDEVCLYLSGSGLRQGQHKSQNSEQEPDGLEEVFLPFDARIDPADSKVVENAIPDYELLSLLAGIRQRGIHVLLIADFCHAGGFAPGDRETPIVYLEEINPSPQTRADASEEPDVPGHGRLTVLSACGADKEEARKRIDPVQQNVIPQNVKPLSATSAVAPSVTLIGRYRVEKTLGEGGFGAVCLAMDDKLNRRVAIKVPKRLSALQVTEYQDEAQKLAKLEHPGVVPIYDIGYTDEYPVFLVTKYIEGGTLSDWAKRETPDFLTIARVIADVAEALQFTHRNGIFHRDIKPANILVDTNGKPFLADFGLALADGPVLATGSGIPGTPAYMSPEQAAGEAHRIDGQTDIFSLGVVLYELLAGRRPFLANEKLPRGEYIAEILEKVKTAEPRPPRQFNDQVPKELERICLKALAKRKPERYTIASDMAEDLRYFAANPVRSRVRQNAGDQPIPTPTPESANAGHQSTPTPTPEAALDADLPTPPHHDSDREPLKIVPRGLRSFEAEDASFFLDLLPGPRDRNGLPESIRFWKTRIESRDPEIMFSSGVMYGPSGCGKSSLVKAGLIPHLGSDIVPIYLEASGDDTELRLARKIHGACPALSDDLSLTLLLTNLRRGIGLPSGKKALIVLDQFEQWLHAKRGLTNQELPAALRQCDGERLQCLILVRDDFWLAISRFLEELEIPLVQGRNCAMADLFDPPHARKVLDAFGVAFNVNVAHAARVSQSSTNDIATPTHASRVRHSETHADYDAFLDQSVAALTEEGKIISVRLALFAEMVKSKPWTPQTLQAIGGVAGVGVAFLEETFSASNAPKPFQTHQVAVRGVLKALLPEVGTDIKGHRVSRDALLQASGYAQRPRDFDSLLHILDRELRLITPVADDEGETGRPGEGEISIENQKSKIENRFYQLAHDYLVPSIRTWLTKKQRETWRGRAQLRLEERTVQWIRQPQSRYLPSLFEYTSIVCGVPRRGRTTEHRRLMRRASRHHLTRWGSLLLLIVAVLFGIERHLAERQRVADDKTTVTRIDLLANATADGVPFAIEPLVPLRELAIPKLRALILDTSASPRDRSHAAYALAELGDTPSRDAIVTTILDAVPTAANDEAKNMVVALNQLSGTALAAGKTTVGGEVTARRRTRETSVGDARSLTTSAMTGLRDITAQIAARANAIELTDDAKRSERLTLKTRYAALALYLGDPSVVSAMCALRPAPSERTAFTLGLKDWPADLSAVRELLQTTEDEALRSAVVAAIGGISKDQIIDFDTTVAWLQELFVTAPDGGSHSAIDWTLRQWDVAHAARVRLPDLSHASRVRHNEPRRWYVNSAGMTFVEVPNGKYRLGEGKETSDVELTRGVYLSNRELTVAQFRAFVDDPQTPASAKPDKWGGYSKGVSPTDDCPVQEISWFDAVLYCNWLSQKEGLTACYQATGKKVKVKDYRDLEYEVDDWQEDFAADGYRLPMEAEWEVACRAGTTTTWNCGTREEELKSFAVYSSNSNGRTQPSGTKLPNGFGLFDIHGNVLEWCNDWYGLFQDTQGIVTGSIGVLRGGNWNHGAGRTSSADRSPTMPIYRDFDYGVRLAQVPGSKKKKAEQ